MEHMINGLIYILIHFIPTILSIICFFYDLKLVKVPIASIIIFLITIVFLVFSYLFVRNSGVFLIFTFPISFVLDLIVLSYLKAVLNSIELKNQKIDIRPKYDDLFDKR